MIDVKKQSSNNQLTLYIVTGVLLGIVIMGFPSLLFFTLGSYGNLPITQEDLFFGGDPPPGAVADFLIGASYLASPLAVFLELILLTVPAIVVVIALFLIAKRHRVNQVLRNVQ